MTGRNGDDLELSLSYELSGISESDAFFEATNAVLGAVLPSDGTAWNHLDLDRRSARVRGTPVELEDENVASLLAHHAHDHPIIASYMAAPTSTPRRMSDLASRSQLLRTGTYADVLRPLDINFQLSILTTRVDRVAGEGWAFSRTSHDFTEEDVTMATRIQSMLCLLTYRRTSAPPPSGREAQSASGLTDRELEVLQLVADGHTAHAIARILRISPATVRKHLERVYAKLGTHDRLMAVRHGQTLGLLTSDPGPRVT